MSFFRKPAEPSRRSPALKAESEPESRSHEKKSATDLADLGHPQMGTRPTLSGRFFRLWRRRGSSSRPSTGSLPSRGESSRKQKQPARTILPQLRPPPTITSTSTSTQRHPQVRPTASSLSYTRPLCSLESRLVSTAFQICFVRSCAVCRRLRSLCERDMRLLRQSRVQSTSLSAM